MQNTRTQQKKSNHQSDENHQNSQHHQNHRNHQSSQTHQEKNHNTQKSSEQIPVITIDGPSGSGKGTISQGLAQKLKWHFLDSGALYRVVALGAVEAGIGLEDIPALAQFAENLPVRFQVSKPGQAPQIYLEGKNVTQAIRSEINGMNASTVAAYPEVRQGLLARQRRFLQYPGLVADGRDMGTVVFPKAQVKIFLTASLEERAKRRFHQLKQQGVKTDLEKVLEEITARDSRDKEREASPTKPAKDACIIDTTPLTIEQVITEVITIIRSKIPLVLSNMVE